MSLISSLRSSPNERRAAARDRVLAAREFANGTDTTDGIPFGVALGRSCAQAAAQRPATLRRRAAAPSYRLSD